MRKYYVIKTTKDGIEYKRTKCLDYWSRTKEGCWQYSLQGAKQISDRLNSQLAPYWRNKIHYNYIKVE